MILHSKNFNGLFDKIAQTLSGRINIQNTISKSREKADLQPLHKDTGVIYRPADRPFASRMRNKQEYLSHLEDKRITNYHLKNR